MSSSRSKSYSSLPSQSDCPWQSSQPTSSLPRRTPRRLRRAPSQASMAATTVPQSLVTPPLGSRHAPTRSSLRHSRLLSSPRYRAPTPPSPPRSHLLLRLLLLLLSLVLTCFLLLQVSLGPGVSSVSSWTPYSSPLLFAWSTITLLVHHWPRTRHSSLLQSTTSPFPHCPSSQISPCLLSSCLTSLMSLSSSLGHLLHLITLQSSQCSPRLSFCQCLSPTSLWQSGNLSYMNLTCTQVEVYLPPLLITLVILNLTYSLVTLVLLALPVIHSARQTKKSISDCTSASIPVSAWINANSPTTIYTSVNFSSVCLNGDNFSPNVHPTANTKSCISTNADTSVKTSSVLTSVKSPYTMYTSVNTPYTVYTSSDSPSSDYSIADSPTSMISNDSPQTNMCTNGNLPTGQSGNNPVNIPYNSDSSFSSPYTSGDSHINMCTSNISPASISYSETSPNNAYNLDTFRTSVSSNDSSPSNVSNDDSSTSYACNNDSSASTECSIDYSIQDKHYPHSYFQWEKNTKDREFPYKDEYKKKSFT